MVLVDTSVWIRGLANKAPFREELDRLLSMDQVMGHELVYGELLIGDLGGRKSLLDAYRLIPQASAVPHSEVVEFVQRRGLNGRGVGWVDVHLLASSLVGKVQFWTADERLAAIAQEFRVGYSAPAR